MCKYCNHDYDNAKIIDEQRTVGDEYIHFITTIEKAPDPILVVHIVSERLDLYEERNIKYCPKCGANLIEDF